MYSRLFHKIITNTASRNQTTSTLLSKNIEFCCFSFGYTQPCTSCPFPPNLLPHLAESSLSKFISPESNSERLEACKQLGLDSRDLDSTTLPQLQQIFRTVAFQIHPDTLRQAKINKDTTPDTREFRKVFESFCLLRYYLEQTTT